MKKELIENLKLSGRLECWAKNTIIGEVVKVVDQKNLVVNGGLNMLRDHIIGASNITITHAGIGSGTAAPIASDTALGSEILRKSATIDTSIGTGKVQFEWQTLTTEANSPGTISEAGLFTASSGGTMFCRATFSPITKDNTVELLWKWTVSFQSL